MIVNKVIYGFVIQTFETTTRECVFQEFIPGDEVAWEMQGGNHVDSDQEAGELYHPIVMPRPRNATTESPKFKLGTLDITYGAIEALWRSNQSAESFLIQHMHGYRGDLDESVTVKNESMVLSSYRTLIGEKIWVVTETDKRCTTILLPGDMEANRFAIRTTTFSVELARPTIRWPSTRLPL